MIKILLTGSTGFIGSALDESISANENFDVTKVVRNLNFRSNNNKCIEVGPFTGSTDFNFALINTDIVIHLASIAHINNYKNSNLTDEYQVCNIDATVALAKQAIDNGVKRFIFLSSIGVNGSKNDAPFTSHGPVQPCDIYAKSKYEAEIALKNLVENTDMEIVIIRPPLVYGKNAPGNFGKLLKIAKSNMPLPFGAINNKRSFVAIDNLVDLISVCIEHPNAANQTFLVSDNEDISISNLIEKLILASGSNARLLSLPVFFLKFLATIFGKKKTFEKFSSSLTVDIEHTIKTLNWAPVISLDEGIRRCFK